MTPAEMELHIRQLEYIVLDLLAQSLHGGQRITGICVNTSLHSHSERDSELDRREHPSGLLVPHYTWEPAVDWSRYQIHLHPENKPSVGG